MKTKTAILTAALVLAAVAGAQQQPPPAMPQQGPAPQGGPVGPPPQPGSPAFFPQRQGGPPPQPAFAQPSFKVPRVQPQKSRPPLERNMPQGPWWNNPQMVQSLNINSEQQKKMDDIFQQNKLRLVDLNAALQKEEIIMEPLMAADSPEEAKILTQIDKIAMARAELEKAHARFLMGIRRVLTQDQWKKLQSEQPRPSIFQPGQGQPPGPAQAFHPAQGQQPVAPRKKQ